LHDDFGDTFEATKKRRNRRSEIDQQLIGAAFRFTMADDDRRVPYGCFATDPVRQETMVRVRPHERIEIAACGGIDGVDVNVLSRCDGLMG
jgi:hypothetical protein